MVAQGQPWERDGLQYGPPSSLSCSGEPKVCSGGPAVSGSSSWRQQPTDTAKAANGKQGGGKLAQAGWCPLGVAHRRGLLQHLTRHASGDTRPSRPQPSSCRPHLPGPVAVRVATEPQFWLPCNAQDIRVLTEAPRPTATKTKAPVTKKRGPTAGKSGQSASFSWASAGSQDRGGQWRGRRPQTLLLCGC